MSHHVDRVDLGIFALRVFLDGRNFLHHLLGDLLRGFRPGIDHLVVFFALRDQAVIILLLEILREHAGIIDDLPLAARHDHVVLAERNARLEGVVETERHDPIAKDHGLFLTAVTIDLIDDAGDFALGHQLVDDIEGHLRRLR